MIKNFNDLLDYLSVDTFHEIVDVLQEEDNNSHYWIIINTKDGDVYDSRNNHDDDVSDILIDTMIIGCYKNDNGLEMEEEFVFPIYEENLDEWIDEMKNGESNLDGLCEDEDYLIDVDYGITLTPEDEYYNDGGYGIINGDDLIDVDEEMLDK